MIVHPGIERTTRKKIAPSNEGASKYYITLKLAIFDPLPWFTVVRFNTPPPDRSVCNDSNLNFHLYNLVKKVHKI